ncbi:hypothetical protein LTS18_009995 [Coniosporium uncinatum]|uniref:Uncharacterized protein n=1 Tax=Coniosporium uncinatum TaxID=93489 RepID=A0ACC3DLE3_9PEZI|nr:hypothetical protein LTS18_009995 [Coniosporium uncinatum]
MAEEVIVASAVVVPDAPSPAPEPLETPEPSLKRRQSSTSESSMKRRRLSTEDDGHIKSEANGYPVKLEENGERTRQREPPSRRKSSQLEERKRGKRLFGGLLNTLSQSSASPAQRRRQDIEKKQHAKLRQQEEEHSQRNQERLDKLLAIRRREQWKFEEQSMRIRHDNMLNLAHFLQTKTEPKLYYKPWELRPEDEERIKDQIEEVEDIIDREVGEFEARRAKEAPELHRRKEKKLDTNGVKSCANEEAPVEVEQKDDPVGDAPPTQAVDITTTTDDGANMANPNTEDHETEETTKEWQEAQQEGQDAEEANEEQADVDMDKEDAGDIVVEGEEDTVIY